MREICKSDTDMLIIMYIVSAFFFFDFFNGFDFGFGFGFAKLTGTEM